ncbi:MAG TPA: hypothetical protein VHB21_20100, partial [Minicystis sp.]|nr:hypothetical protein [Minicystis sp.]
GERDADGWIIEGFTEIATRGDRSALLAARGNETLTNLTYASALERGGLEGDARVVVERCYADEQRHLAWIKDALAARSELAPESKKRVA